MLNMSVNEACIVNHAGTDTEMLNGGLVKNVTLEIRVTDQHHRAH